MIGSAARAWRMLAAGALMLTIVVGCERAPSSTNQTGETAPSREPVTEVHADPNLEVSVLSDLTASPVIDAAERDTPAPRIVSTAPNITEILCAMGLSDAIVGRTRYCTHPPRVLAIPSIGALLDLNVERLVALKPDLILLSGESTAQAERLRPLGISFETVPDYSLDDLRAAIRKIGELTHRPRSAEKLIKGIDAQLADLTKTFANMPQKRVLIVTGVLSDPPQPPYVAGPGSFYDDLLKLANVENVAPDGHGAFAPLALETIVRLDPDVIIELDPDGSGRPGGDAEAVRVWGQLPGLSAPKRSGVRVLTGSYLYLLGPRVVQLQTDLYVAISEAGEAREDGE